MSIPKLRTGSKVTYGGDQFVITKLGIDRFDIQVTKSTSYVIGKVYSDQIISLFFYPGSQWKLMNPRLDSLPEWI